VVFGWLRPSSEDAPSYLDYVAADATWGIVGAFFAVLPFATALWVVRRLLLRWDGWGRLRWMPGLPMPDATRASGAVCAAWFGYSWQLSLMSGDGIRAHPLYAWIRVGAAVLGASLSAAFLLVLTSSRLPWRGRIVVALLSLCTAMAVNVGVLRDYAQFHGHLALFQGGMVAWLCARGLQREGWLGNARRRRTTAWGCATLCAALCGWATCVSGAERERAFRHVKHYSHLTVSMLDAFPLSRLLLADDDARAFGGAPLTEDESAAFRRELEPWSSPGAPRGRNVIFIVLESTRSDLWSDPRVAPRFAQWRRRGVYFPRAVAQYPATPLAYGAMFTSQTPVVLTYGPAWVKARLFDKIAGRFDHLILTRPDVTWFEHVAITDFFVDRSQPLHKHESSEHALAYLKGRLQALGPRETFFAWAHLYEPHDPYELRPDYDVISEARLRGAYAAHVSELACVDAHLGAFMDWFYQSGLADDTLVIVAGDHGEGLGEWIDGRAYWGHHVEVRNVVSHVPMFFSGPGLTPDEVLPEVGVSQLDIMPTVFDFLGQELPADAFVQGKSVYGVLSPERRAQERVLPTSAFSIRGKELFDFIAAVRRSDPEQARSAFEHVVYSNVKYSPKVAIELGRWKLIRDLGLDTYALYDLAVDPDERHDLAHSHKETLQRMTQALSAWQRRQHWIASELERTHHTSW
jgi:hypothetical protein